MNEGLTKQVAQTIEQHHLLDPSRKHLVALSGGADSVALVHVLLRLNYKIEALHCNFNLRGEESMRDEKFVVDLCTKLSVPLHIKSFETLQYCKANKISIEMGARELRYQWFEDMRKSLEADTICVAHHQNDQAETLLLNLLRGTGLRGLAGMHYRNGDIVRPMLDCSREDIVNYLQGRNISWVEDHTNFERDAIRNRIRLDVLPMLQTINPKAIRNFAKTASIIQETIPIFERGLHAKSHTFCAESQTELHEMLRDCGFTNTQVSDIWLAGQGKLVESATHRLLKNRNTFILRERGYHAPEPILKYNTIERGKLHRMSPDTLYLDDERLKKPLCLRKAKTGDRIIPFGMKGSKLVSDLLTDLKLNRFEKEDQYVLTDTDDTILWVVGRRASDLYKVTDKTQSVLCVECPKLNA